MKFWLLFGWIFASVCFLPSTKCQWPIGVCNDNMIIGHDCYLIYLYPHSYMHAKMTCELDDGTLAIIKDNITHEKILSLARSEIRLSDTVPEPGLWIGLHDRILEGIYEFGDGTYLNSHSYSPWGAGEPSDSRELNYWRQTNDCVYMSIFTGRWHDGPCDKERQFVCQYKSRPCKTKSIVISNANFDNCTNHRDMTLDAEISIECQEGFILIGSPKVKCLGTGRWSEPPKCVRGCHSPPQLPNALMITKKDYYVSGDNVVYLCDEGFFANGNSKRSHFSRTCSRSGLWLPSKAGCSQPYKYKTAGLEIRPEESVHLVCNIDTTDLNSNASRFSRGEKMQFFWFKDSVDIRRTNIEFKINSNGDLEILGRQDFAGMYTCILKGKRLIPGNIIYDLKYAVDGCEIYSEETMLYAYTEGDSAWLACPHSSSYEGFHWFKDGEYFNLNEDQILYPDGSLYIKRVEFYHEGKYTCMMTKKDTFCTKNITAEVAVSSSAASICGNPTKSRNHPWTVSLWWKDEVAPFCYGALIHENWIVTTAQCLSGLYRKQTLDIFVRFHGNSDDFIDIPIKTVKTHPLFSKKRHANDIGLVELKQPFKFSKTIQPICLTSVDLTMKSACEKSSPVKAVTTGWGHMEKIKLNEMSLQEEDMIFVDHDECFPTESHYSDKVLCFRHDDQSNTTLASDSGSPIEVSWKDRIYLLGLYSWGDRISHLGDYDYFTNVSNYMDWIANYIE